MTNACSFAIPVLLLATLAGSASAQGSQDRFTQLDRNGDGRVDQDEYEAGARASFASMDTNRDGWIGLDELRATLDPNAGGIGADGMARTQLAAMDLNDDKLISEDEFVAFANQSIATFDKDGDGRLTRADFQPR
jgi:Ca2+-binding EF-hand superfamily protein